MHLYGNISILTSVERTNVKINKNGHKPAVIIQTDTKHNTLLLLHKEQYRMDEHKESGYKHFQNFHIFVGIWLCLVWLNRD